MCFEMTIVQIEYINNDNIAFSMNQFCQNFRGFFSWAIIFSKFLDGIEEKAPSTTRQSSKYL